MLSQKRTAVDDKFSIKNEKYNNFPSEFSMTKTILFWSKNLPFSFILDLFGILTSYPEWTWRIQNSGLYWVVFLKLTGKNKWIDSHVDQFQEVYI